MNENCVDYALSELRNLNRDSCLSSPVKDQVNHLLLELRFLDLYTQCLAKWNEALQDEKNRHLRESKILHINATLGGATNGLYSAGIKTLQTQDSKDWEILASELLEKVQLCKLKIREDCLDFLDCSFHYQFSSSELKKFYCCLLDSLNELIRLKVDTISDLKVQIQGIKEKLQLLMKIFKFKPCTGNINKDVNDFKILIQTWLHNAACLLLLYWIAEENQEEIESRKKIFLCTPRITEMFLAVLKSLRSSSSRYRLLIHEGVLNFADFFLEILQVYPLENIETLHTGLIFLTTFLVDPPLAKDAEPISKEVRSLICSLSAKEVKEAAAEKDAVVINSFLGKMNRVIAEVKKVYARIFQDSVSFNFPITNVLGFIDSLLDDLKGISDRSTNHEVVIVQEELQSLRPFLVELLHKEDHKIKYLKIEIVNAVYRAKIGIQLHFYVNNSVWYEAKCLSDVTDEIKLLKCKIIEILDQEIYNVKVPAAEEYTSLSRANKPRTGEEFVGLEDESETIIDQLTGDSKALTIVSIFGMAGLGKTTLAKKIFDNPSVRKHFSKQAWCTVSQAYQTRRLFLEILSGAEPNGDFSTMADEELEQLLKQSLSGHKYLIIMDDIWDLGAWNALNLSFPNQNKGSRIMFTSRIKIEDLEAKPNCILHGLRALYFDESCELLRRKLFGKAGFPLNLKAISEQIAKDCNGLPLAIVVIAGILSEKVDDLDWWKYIAGSIDSQATDVCMDILELSYKHLPEFLKPCFLYFGAFQEDKVIRVRKLIQLWISEGFIQKLEKNLEEVAKEYLMNLIARSLVLVAQKSSKGGIKTCHIHDLLHTFCLRKASEENFLQVGSWGEQSPNSTGTVLKNYRICIQTGEKALFASNPLGPCVHSLLFFTDSSFYVYEWELFCIGNFKLLHVLDLEDIEFNGYFPEEVVRLALLRYLAIWCTSGALSIPPSIANLRNLETFLVKRFSRFGNEVALPNTIWKMKSLRHLDVGRFVAFVPDDSEPQESSVLDNIQSFSAPSLCYGEATEKLLRRIAKVQKLKCQFGDSGKECNQFPVLKLLSKLESLNVIYTGKLFKPYEFSFPSTLKKLTLWGFKLPWSQISTIANLPELEVLKLLDNAFDGKTWDLQDDDFPKLKFLKLCNLNIEEWDIICDYPFPCLEQLIVEDCKKLKEIPFIFGEFIYALKRIEVRWCNHLVTSSARQIGEHFDRVEVIVLGQQSVNQVLVGFENELRIIINQLTYASAELNIVSIVGMPGIGKTTLAKMVYNHPIVCNYFHKRTWCYVSRIYQRRALLLDILIDVCGLDIHRGSSGMAEEDLAELLYKYLKGRRYLIVLDDVWDFRAWYDLKISFPDDHIGSRVLFTSRRPDVAFGAKPNTITHLHVLCAEESWKLFETKLFAEGHCPPDFEVLGKQILRQCEGLPLAISVVVGLLLEKVDNLGWWQRIAESLRSQINDPKDLYKNLLELRYKYLPGYLKPCFLYFGAFGDTAIRTRRLIQLWISEGFIPKSDRRSPEDTAEEFLRDLVSRNLVAVTKKSSTGGIRACQLEGFLSQSCLSKGIEEKFLQVENHQSLYNSKDAIYEDYRLYIESQVDVFFARNPSGPCVHSLLFGPNHIRSDEVLDLSSICNFKRLQVLDMEEVELNGYFPEVVTLLLLRYLAIWCRSGKLSVPPSIANLTNLETFRLKREVGIGNNICLPDTLWRMERLRHIDVGVFTISFSGECDPDVEYLILDNIRTFSAPSVSLGEDAEELLRRLPRVRKLKCQLNDSRDPYQKQNRFPAFGVLTELESLYVRYVGRPFYPCALDFPSILKKLSFANFMLPWSEMSTIGKLPNLEVLKLLEDAFFGKEWNVEDVEYSFSKLKFLKLCQLNIARWNVSGDAFPCLEHLIVENCVELEEIPSAFALVPTLTMVEVRGCKSTVAISVQNIEEEQRELGNFHFEARMMDAFGAFLQFQGAQMEHGSTEQEAWQEDSD